MGLWGTDAIDLVGPGFIEFDGRRSGWLSFIAVKGQLDFRETIPMSGPPRSADLTGSLGRGHRR